MNWQEICERPDLQNLPFKVELNERGQILMSPVKVYHSAFQGKIARLLPDYGVILSECAVRTAKGTKVADIAWCSEQRFMEIRSEAECSVAPEICIEVLSYTNTKEEMEEKRHLFISAGAEEFWICDVKGKMTFFNRDGKIKRSALVPNFPVRVKVLLAL
jgi:Uma2 family endonuclease